MAKECSTGGGDCAWNRGARGSEEMRFYKNRRPC
jgi:hypothetical protein